MSNNFFLFAHDDCKYMKETFRCLVSGGVLSQ